MKKQLIDAAPLTAELVKKHLRTRFIGREIHHLPSTFSTNTIAQQLARAGRPEGTVVITDYQTHGRGRLERKWLSPQGEDLLFSLIMRPALEPAQAFKLILVSSLAVSQAIRRKTGLEALIKWPNDIYIRGKSLNKNCMPIYTKTLQITPLIKLVTKINFITIIFIIFKITNFQNMDQRKLFTLIG